VDGLAGLTDEQGGGRERRGTESQLMALWTAIESRVYGAVEAEEALPLAHAVFFDFSKAFDTVPQPLLWAKMRNRYGIRGPVWWAVRRLYDGAGVRVRCKEGLGGYIPQLQGVRQGGVLSPMLYALHLDEGIERAKAAMGADGGLAVGAGTLLTRLRALGFCDDLVLTAEDGPTLQRGTDALALYAAETGSSFNLKPRKTATMSFVRKGEVLPAALPKMTMPTFTESGGRLVEAGRKRINRVGKYTYLGVLLRTVLDPNDMQEVVRRRLYLVTLKLERAVTRATLGSKDYLAMVRSRVLPHILHAAAVWGDVSGARARKKNTGPRGSQAKQSLEDVWRAAVARAWGGSRLLPLLAPAVLLDAGLRTCVMFARQHRLRAICSCLAFGEGHMLHRVLRAALSDDRWDDDEGAQDTWVAQTRAMLRWMDERNAAAAGPVAVAAGGGGGGLLDAVMAGRLQRGEARRQTDTADAREFAQWLRDSGGDAEGFRRVWHGGVVEPGTAVPAHAPVEPAQAKRGLLRVGTTEHARGSMAPRGDRRVPTLRLAIRSSVQLGMVEPAAPAPRLETTAARHVRAHTCPGCARAGTDVSHLLLRCPRFASQRARLVAALRRLGPIAVSLREAGERGRIKTHALALPPWAAELSDAQLCAQWGPVWLACAGAGLREERIGGDRDNGVDNDGNDVPLGGGTVRVSLQVVHAGAQKATARFLKRVLGEARGGAAWTARCQARNA